jgi:serine protease AprX
MDDSDTAAREDDVLAPFSSRGPTLIDHIVKPDLVAPGTLIVSLRTAGSTIDLEHHDLVLRVSEYRTGPDGDRDGDYLVLSGTSLAAPMVAGAAALLLQQDATLKPADVKARLMASALHDEHLPFETGAGYLDVEAALASGVRAASALSPRAVPGPDGTIVLEPLGIGWEGDWKQSLIWGGGRYLGTLSETENDQVTATGLVWGGGRSIVGAAGLVWGGGSRVAVSDADLVCTGIVWGGGH